VEGPRQVGLDVEEVADSVRPLLLVPAPAHIMVEARVTGMEEAALVRPLEAVEALRMSLRLPLPRTLVKCSQTIRETVAAPVTECCTYPPTTNHLGSPRNSHPRSPQDSPRCSPQLNLLFQPDNQQGSLLTLLDSPVDSLRLNRLEFHRISQAHSLRVNPLGSRPGSPLGNPRASPPGTQLDNHQRNPRGNLPVSPRDTPLANPLVFPRVNPLHVLIVYQRPNRAHSLRINPRDNPQ